MRAIHFHVSGRVQGVWFRASTQREATRLGLDGWVRNLADGRVEGWAQGEAGAVDRLESWLREGPRLARVEELEVEEVAEAEVEGFRVR